MKKNLYDVNINQENAEMAILISDQWTSKQKKKTTKGREIL